MTRDSIWTTALSRTYAFLLYAYPSEFRTQFGAEMRQVFRDRCRAIAAAAEPAPLIVFLLGTIGDWLSSSIRERVASMTTVIRNNWRWRTARGLAVAALTILAYLFITTELMQAYVISGPSMEDTLRIGDHILVNKRAQIGRDELVSFRHPENERVTLVKRVIGVPGDRIHLVDKQVIRNGRRLIEPYAKHRGGADPYRDNFPADPPAEMSQRGRKMLDQYVASGEVTVPAGSLFVLGDNRDNSLDSRYFGFVPGGYVIGRPVFVYWSYDVAKFTKTRWERTLRGIGFAPPQEVEP